MSASYVREGNAAALVMSAQVMSNSPPPRSGRKECSITNEDPTNANDLDPKAQLQLRDDALVEQNRKVRPSGRIGGDSGYRQVILNVNCMPNLISLRSNNRST